jgi:type II secretory pathway component GspD/PulD (secretin)
VVSVSGVIYEVSLSKTDSSALSLFGSILKSHIGIDMNRGSGGNTASLKIGGLDAVFSALDSDSRFKVVSNPSLTVRSGSSARLTVGEEVPTAGTISQNNSGQTFQSVEYKSSGVILDFKPQVLKETIRVNFQQTVSSFVKTETGINNSPTLIKREARSDVDLSDGELLVVGGLTDNKESSGRSSFPVPFLSSLVSKNSSNRSTELLILLKVQKLSRENFSN